MRYLLRNMVAHKLMKIKVGQGEGFNKQRTYHYFNFQIIIFHTYSDNNE